MVIFLALFVLSSRRQQTFTGLLKSRLRFAEPAPVARDAMPAEVASLLDEVRPELEAEGFAYVHTEAATPLSVYDPRPARYNDVYWHPEHATLAAVGLAEPYSGQPVSVAFTATFADGVTLETLNRGLWATIAPDLPGHVFEDAYADTLDGQWQAHLKALERESAAHGRPGEREAALAAWRGDNGAYVAWLTAKGWLVEDTPGIHRFTVKGAWHYARRSLRGAKRVGPALKRPFRSNYTPDLRAQRSHELAGFATAVEQAAQPLPRWMKAVMFAVTFAFSLALFGHVFSLLFAAAVLLVLLVHESGHLLAMRAFGFRNLSMIFLPFFGAVATGHKPHVKPWQETIILLAGPLPGLLAALLLSQLSLHGMTHGEGEFLRMVFWSALLINLFNLLPVGILDGGKLFQLALLSRFPYVKAVFWVGGAVIGAIYGMVNGLLIITLVMLLLLLSARNQFRAARAVSVIHARAKADGKFSNGKTALSKEDAIAYLGAYLAQPEFNEASTSGWARRRLIAAAAYPRLLQGVPALSTSAGVLAAHSAAFLLPLLAAAWLVQQPQKPPLLRPVPYPQTAAGKAELAKEKRVVAAARDRFLARYRAAHDPRKKWAMLDDAEDPDISEFDPDPAWLKRQRAALLPQLPVDHPARLWPQLRAAAKAESRAQARARILAVIRRLDHGDGARIATLDAGRFRVLRAAWRMLARWASPQTLVAQNALLETAWRNMSARDAAWRKRENWRRSALASSAAHLAFAAGDTARARQWMARRACCYPEGDAMRAPDQGWFLLDIGQPDAAHALALQALNAPGVDSYWRDAWLSVAGWAEMADHRPRAADAYFSRAARAPQTRVPRHDLRHFNVATWLIGVIRGQPGKKQRPITNAMLDHLAALQAYDPAGAARYRATLAGRMDARWRKFVAPYLVGPVDSDGWGRLRTDTLEKLLDISPAAVARVE